MSSKLESALTPDLNLASNVAYDFKFAKILEIETDLVTKLCQEVKILFLVKPRLFTAAQTRLNEYGSFKYKKIYF